MAVWPRLIFRWLLRKPASIPILAQTAKVQRTPTRAEEKVANQRTDEGWRAGEGKAEDFLLFLFRFLLFFSGFIPRLVQPPIRSDPIPEPGSLLIACTSSRAWIDELNRRHGERANAKIYEPIPGVSSSPAAT
jgi:hypothetical protein